MRLSVFPGAVSDTLVMSSNSLETFMLSADQRTVSVYTWDRGQSLLPSRLHCAIRCFWLQARLADRTRGQTARTPRWARVRSMKRATHSDLYQAQNRYERRSPSQTSCLVTTTTMDVSICCSWARTTREDGGRSRSSRWHSTADSAEVTSVREMGQLPL